MIKKGMSHVEVILSFVIFVSFLVFILAMFNPFKPAEKSRTSLDIIERGLESSSGTEVKFITLKLDMLPSKNIGFSECFYVAYNFTDVIVKNSMGSYIEARSQDNKIYIKGDEQFYYIYSSSEFSESSFDLSKCIAIPEDSYQLGLYRTYSFESNNSLYEFGEEYKNNYENLKTRLGFPASDDFVYTIFDSEGKLITQPDKEIPRGVMVIAKDVPIQIVYSNGDLKTAVLNIRVW